MSVFTKSNEEFKVNEMIFGLKNLVLKMMRDRVIIIIRECNKIVTNGELLVKNPKMT